MEGHALGKFQDQKNVILSINYLPIYFQETGWTEYEGPDYVLNFFYILQVMTVCIYPSSGADDRNQLTCNITLSRTSFCTHILIFK